MKTVKTVLLFVIFFFMVTIFNGMVSLARKISFGNAIIETGFYIFIAVLFLIFLVIPLIKYIGYPSSSMIRKMNEGSKAAADRLYRHYFKNGRHEPGSAAGVLTKEGEPPSRADMVRKQLGNRIDEFDKEIRAMALKLTTTVVLSPNSFIDGLTIILGNSQLIYKLSKTLGIRYTAKELFDMYFRIFSIASFSGLIQEFDDEIEEFVRETINMISEDATKEIPLVKIIPRAISPLIQASANYAFIIYNGKRFKYMMKRLVDNNGMDEREINILARKDARRSRITYFRDMNKKVFKAFKLKILGNKKEPEPNKA
ncbi:MAG: DUF697 domain-containing protein [Clostridia bacterium]|nr:DUF697 domain-containing protein [Clostridia bacterium]